MTEYMYFSGHCDAWPTIPGSKPRSFVFTAPVLGCECAWEILPVQTGGLYCCSLLMTYHRQFTYGACVVMSNINSFVGVGVLQVRRTVGVLVGVAQGRLSLQDVQHMLDHPSQRNWKTKAQVAPPDGLFLLDVEYPPHVFAEEEEDSEQQPPQE